MICWYTHIRHNHNLWKYRAGGVLFKLHWGIISPWVYWKISSSCQCIFFHDFVWLYKSSRQEVKMFLKICEDSQENATCLNLILNKVAGRDLQLKKRLWHRCFLVNFGKLLGTHILQNTFGRLFPIVKKVIFLSSPHTNFSNVCCNNCVLQSLKITSKVSVYKNNHGFKLLFYLEI